MPRDNERYAYYMVGIPRESALHQKILHDARERGMLDAVARLLVVRLGDWYDQGGTVKASIEVPVESEPVITAPAAPTAGEEIDLEMAAQNASAALDAWL